MREVLYLTGAIRWHWPRLWKRLTIVEPKLVTLGWKFLFRVDARSGEGGRGGGVTRDVTGLPTFFGLNL